MLKELYPLKELTRKKLNFHLLGYPIERYLKKLGLGLQGFCNLLEAALNLKMIGKEKLSLLEDNPLTLE